MIIGKSNLASVFKAMPKQDDDIFEFNPTSLMRIAAITETEPFTVEQAIKIKY
ncbi:MAG: hypothetical protein ACRC1Z_00305 [Waterburya sp.]